MRLIVHHQDGSEEAAIFIAFIGSRVRAFLPGSDDAVEFRFTAGRWVAESGQVVQIRFGVAEDEFNALVQAAADAVAPESVIHVDLETQLWSLLTPGPAASPALVH